MLYVLCYSFRQIQATGIQHWEAPANRSSGGCERTGRVTRLLVLALVVVVINVSATNRRIRAFQERRK